MTLLFLKNPIDGSELLTWDGISNSNPETSSKKLSDGIENELLICDDSPSSNSETFSKILDDKSSTGGETELLICGWSSNPEMSSKILDGGGRLLVCDESSISDPKIFKKSDDGNNSVDWKFNSNSESLICGPSDWKLSPTSSMIKSAKMLEKDLIDYLLELWGLFVIIYEDLS